MTRTPITGANKGLGFQTARRLLAAGHTVYLGSRDVELGIQAAGRPGACAIQRDVTDDTSGRAAVQTVEDDGGLDVLVTMPASKSRWMIAARVLHAFLPLLQQSGASVVVEVSSGLASLTRLTTPGTTAYNYPGVAYPASKAALNLITVHTQSSSRPCGSMPTNPASPRQI